MKAWQRNLLSIAAAAGLAVAQSGNTRQSQDPNTQPNESGRQTQRGNADTTGSRSQSGNQSTGQSDSAATGNQSGHDMKGMSGSSTLSSADKKFIMEAAQGGMMEVELGKLAQEKGASQDVKDFGKRMVEDHSKANDELKQLASKLGVDLPADLGAKHKSEVNRFQNMSGEQFDQAYKKHMLADHKKDVKEFEKASNRQGNQDVSGWAGKTLPTLQSHLQEIQSMQGAGGNSKNKNNKNASGQ